MCFYFWLYVVVIINETNVEWEMFTRFDKIKDIQERMKKKHNVKKIEIGKINQRVIPNLEDYIINHIKEGNACSIKLHL